VDLDHESGMPAKMRHSVQMNRGVRVLLIEKNNIA
jgi:hypothetical protein